MTADLTLTQLRALVDAMPHMSLLGPDAHVEVDRFGERWHIRKWTGPLDGRCIPGEPVTLAELCVLLRLAPSVPSGWERRESVEFWKCDDETCAEVWYEPAEESTPWIWATSLKASPNAPPRECGSCATEPEAIVAAEAAVERLRGGR